MSDLSRSVPFSGASTTTHNRLGAHDFASMKTPSKRNGFTAGTETDGRAAAPLPDSATQGEEEVPEEKAIDAAVDPISALKKIFKAKEKIKRAPVDAHPVMNKYK